MPSESILTSRIASLRRDIETLQRQDAEHARNQASNTAHVARARRSITSSTSGSTLQSKLSEIQRYEDRNSDLVKKRADVSKRISDKISLLHRAEADLDRERSRQHKQLLDSMRRRDSEIQQLTRSVSKQVQNTYHQATHGDAPVEYDAFISHASEDKDDFVRPLAAALQHLGFKIWFDELELKVGDSLRRSIDAGLARSRYGIVVLSEAFFSKNWPQYELDGLVAKENQGSQGKVVLPVWHKVSKDQVLSYSPSLADKVALNTALFTVPELANQLAAVLKE